ncbi:hypothetical protein ACFOTA_13955 [Chitinophaga sp. GCM10012297]|uniref:Uncharacterized protein n=1 Tax=Chitinophaga chungangae TaxID=2821488 RepID=A0ABS3YF65_9BACT|nr:hypothetical protein [Chitinophaga chungangae]MBO9153320.1 hypothetical protein [Chitinophaga chungangae]
MRKPLLDIQEIENFLLKKMPSQEKTAFEARMIISPQLETAVDEQRQALRLIRLTARDRQREKLSAIYDQLAQDPSFTQTIHAIFY